MDREYIIKDQAARFANEITLDPDLRNYQPSDFTAFSLPDGTLIATSSRISVIVTLGDDLMEFYYKCTEKKVL